MRKYLLLSLCFFGWISGEAKVNLPKLFQSGMVLQREKPIPVWGKADAGETVTVSLGKSQVTTTADEKGNWRVDLPKMKAGGPYTLLINKEKVEEERITLNDVLIGDVWLCSGQSNIDVTIERVYPQYRKEIDSYENPQVRLFRVQNETDTHGPKEDILSTPINWKPLSKENAWLFSAVGYFLGKRMQEKTGVPQGIIVNSWGGTPIEAWISADSLQREFPLFVKRTQLYQNDEMVRAQQEANQLAARRWTELLDTQDAVAEYIRADYDDSNWEETDQYAPNWAMTSGHPIIGSIWLRQHINIDKEHAGKPARLLLGTLFDMDYTYVNGRQVGVTYYQYPPRRYDIPEGLLHEGDNVITVRFINKFGMAHFIKEKPYLLAFGEDRMSLNPMPEDVIPLSRTWKYHPGVEMPSCPSADVSLQNLPTTLYNAVLHPLAPYALSGVVWYQGESNTGGNERSTSYNGPKVYGKLLQTMMNNWRARWQDQEMPFVIVQLANFMEPSEQPQNSSWARLREAQRQVAEADPRAELCVINDLGETVDIHPLRKREVAERIGLCFDRLVFGDKKVRLSPKVIATSVKTKEKQILLTLDQRIRPCEVHEMELRDADGPFKNVKAEAKDDQIIIDTSGITSPTAIRYAWKDNPLRANVRSLDGLPLSSFEIDLDKK